MSTFDVGGNLFDDFQRITLRKTTKYRKNIVNSDRIFKIRYLNCPGMMEFVESADRSIKLQDGAGLRADSHEKEILRMESV
jgi:threonyl-tRNA synthetase